jgi:hypothetical protein
MAGLTAIKRKRFQGGGADMSTVSAADLGISSDTSKREYTPSEKQEQRETRELNKRIAENQAQRERDAVIEEILVTPTGRNKRLNAFQLFNNKFQRQKNLELARKRAFQKYRDIEQYVDVMDDYSLTPETLAAEMEKAQKAGKAYGYDFSGLEKGKELLGSNIGTSIESYRRNLYDVNPSQTYSAIQSILNAARPDTQVTAANTLQKARDYTSLLNNANTMTNQALSDAMTELKNRGKTPDQINPPEGRGEGNQVYLPYQQVLPEDDYEREQKEFAFRFGDPQQVGADVTRASYIFNQGGRVPAAGGGIMNAVPRQGFFLGKIAKGIGKAVGSVAKAAGKVLKSDFGKAAVLGLGGYYLGGGQMFGLRPNAPGFSFGKLGSSLFLKPGKETFSFANLDPLKMAGLLTLGGAAMGPAKQDTLGDGTRGQRLLDSQGNEVVPAEIRAEIREAYESGDADKIAAIQDYYNFLPGLNAVRLPDVSPYLPYPNYADGGRIGYAGGGGKTQLELPFGEPDYYIGKGENKVGIYRQKDGKLLAVPVGLDGLPNYAQGGRIKAQEGGLMNLGGMEKDYRNTGGFVDIGAKEKADDVPARLSVNEFVFTADAVRNAGDGDIDKGAEVMENMMKNLENGGKVSEESQGNTGAQEMFSVSERIGEVI